jgi:hypothetical protein
MNAITLGRLLFQVTGAFAEFERSKINGRFWLPWVRKPYKQFELAGFAPDFGTRTTRGRIEAFYVLTTCACAITATI